MGKELKLHETRKFAMIFMPVRKDDFFSILYRWVHWTVFLFLWDISFLHTCIYIVFKWSFLVQHSFLGFSFSLSPHSRYYWWADQKFRSAKTDCEVSCPVASVVMHLVYSRSISCRVHLLNYCKLLYIIFHLSYSATLKDM